MTIPRTKYLLAGLVTTAAFTLGMAATQAQAPAPATRTPAATPRAQTPAIPPAAAPGAAATERALVDRYCVTCHNERLKTGGLVLEGRDFAKVPADGETFEKVI